MYYWSLTRKISCKLAALTKFLWYGYSITSIRNCLQNMHIWSARRLHCKPVTELGKKWCTHQHDHGQHSRALAVSCTSYFSLSTIQYKTTISLVREQTSENGCAISLAPHPELHTASMHLACLVLPRCIQVLCTDLFNRGEFRHRMNVLELRFIGQRQF